MNPFQEFVRTREAWPEAKKVFIPKSLVTEEFAEMCRFGDGKLYPTGSLMGIIISVVPDVFVAELLKGADGKLLIPSEVSGEA